MPLPAKRSLVVGVAAVLLRVHSRSDGGAAGAAGLAGRINCFVPGLKWAVVPANCTSYFASGRVATH